MIAILFEVLFILMMIISSIWNPDEVEYTNVIVEIVSYIFGVLLISFLPMAMFFTKEYELNDEYPQCLAEELLNKNNGKIGKKAYQELEKAGVEFEKTPDGLIVKN
jgi:hypothetical protein